MKARLTKRSVDGLKPGVTPDGSARPDFLWDTDLTGFGCKVTATGRKVYILQYRTRGQPSTSAPKRLTLGAHGTLTPNEARRLAAEALLTIKAGGDPASDRTRRDVPTVAMLATRFLEEYLPTKKRPPRASTVSDYERIFRRHVVPAMGNRPVAGISPDEIEHLHQKMRSSPYQANRMLSLLHQAFAQAERWGWRPERSNPARHIDRYPERRRGAAKEVMLTPEQMEALLKALDVEEAEGRDPIACAAIRVAFWTGWRISEVLGLEWANLELEQGRAKLLRTKTAEEEYRHLPAEAIDVIRRLPHLDDCRYVFPGRDARAHLTTVRKPWVRIRRRAGLHDLEGLGPLRLHDLRHNVVSWDVSRGVPLEIAGRNVGHRSRQATEVYAHFAPDALKRAADERARAMRRAVEKAKRAPLHGG